MEKYIIAPPAGSQTNALGAKDRPWEEVHANRYPGINEYLAESTGYGIVSGCEPSISGLTVTVGAGVIHLADGTRKEIVQTNITLDNADPTNPRIDLVYIDSTGAVAKVTGTASASPVVSSVPAGGISVCNIILAAGATTGTIINSRMMLNTYQYCVNVKSYGAVGDGVHDDTTAIQTAINYAQSQLGNSAIVYFPRGEYKVTSTLHVDIQRVNMLGDVVTLTYYGTDSTGLLHIDGYSNNTVLPIPDIKHRVRFIRGFTFNNKSGANDSIAVYSGTTEYTTESTAHGARDFIIDSCAFNFFNKGVYISYNSYLFSLHYCASFATDYVIYDRQVSNNSGENIVIYRGVFTDFDTAIKVQSPNTQIRVHNTSFDGKGNQILDMETLAGNNHCDVVSFVDCHFECGGSTEKPLFRVVSGTGFQRVNIVRATSFLGVRYPYMVETGGNDYVYITDSYFDLVGGETSWGNTDRVVVRNTKVYGNAPLMYGHSLIKQPTYGWILTDGTLKYGTGFELLQPKFWIYRHGNSWDTTGTRVTVDTTNKIYVDTAVHHATEKSSLAIQADYDKYFQAALLAPCEQDYCYTFIYKIMVYVDKKYEGFKLLLLPTYHDTAGGDYKIISNSAKIVMMDNLTVGDWTAIYAYTPLGTAIPPTAKYIGLQIEIGRVDGYSDSKNVKINIGKITYQRY